MKSAGVRFALLMASAATALLALVPAAQAASPAPELRTLVPDSVEPGGLLPQAFGILNNGDAAMNGQIVVRETVSPGLTAPTGMQFVTSRDGENSEGSTPIASECQSTELTLTCVLDAGEIKPGVQIWDEGKGFTFSSVAPGASGQLTVEFEVSGGGAPPVSVMHTVSAGPHLPYGIANWANELRDASRAPFRQAGSAPAAFLNFFRPVLDTRLFVGLIPMTAPGEWVKDAVVHLPPGMLGNPLVAPYCPFVDLILKTCPKESQLGVFRGSIGGDESFPKVVPIYNVEPPAGAPASFALNVLDTVAAFTARVRQSDYGIDVVSRNTSTTLLITEGNFEFWGVPADQSHDTVRGESCLPYTHSRGSLGIACPSSLPRRSFLRTPTSCTGKPLEVGIEINTYEHPAVTHSALDQLPGMTGCDRIPFSPAMSARPTTLSTESPSGLDVHVEMPNPGLTNPDGISESDVKSARVILPEGITINPSQAEGLSVCSQARYGSTELSFHPQPGNGCPSDSKIGSVTVKTPLLEETLHGSAFVAEPYDNPFGSLLALYIVIENPERGILVKLAGKVDLDPRTGQITTTFDDLPQTPFSSFDFHFREGARAPLVTPRACGTYTTAAQFRPWSDPSRSLTSHSSFQITSGVGSGPCPSGGLPPFRPGLQAGTLNNAAGSYSPFNARLFRSDGEQEFTNFSLKLPPGVIGKIAGLGYCSEAAIAAARSREGKPGGGAQELASPSCPASSRVGRTLVGAGVGSVRAYAPGDLYYAGPYNGSAISLVSITAAKVGPFDLGTLVVRFAIRVNPETAEIFIDSTGSDPIPHIIHGVTAHLRDIRGYVDRPDFTLNPTSCERTSVASTLLGSGLDFASAADDLPVTVSTPFQAADCAALGFRPQLRIALSGQMRRAGNPKLQAIYTPRPGDANLERARVTLPRSAFLDNAHIGTVCTRVQFNRGSRPGDACPAGSVYGHAHAVSPLLDYPLEGSVFLRSNPERELPDIVAALHGPQFDINAVAHVDSFGKGQIRTTFEGVPDAPLTRVVLTMAGGKKGLLENSRNLCQTKNRAIVSLDAHNGKYRDFRPLVKPTCGKSKKGKQPVKPAPSQPQSPYRGG